MADHDAIRWLDVSNADVVLLRSAVADAMPAFPEVVAAYHYGSSVRGSRARDVDIGLVVDRAAMRSIDVDRVAEAIAARCGRSVDDLDVRVVNDADAVFLGNLMREGVRCYERDAGARIAFEVQAMNAWLDFQPVWDRLRNRVLGAWSRG